MIPVTFDGVMAKIHPARGDHTSGLGVVIVPPHGVEALAATKSLRLLADALAAKGHACLRLDLPGTGDSLGTDADADRIEAWTRSIVSAAQVLSTHTGVTGTVVLGLRLGALLAARAAPDIDNLAGLVLLDPITRGRTYARELTVTARAVAEGARLDPDATSTPAGVLIGGLLTSTATLEALRGLDIAKLPEPAAPVLVLHRKGAQDAAPLATAWPASPVIREEASGLDGIALSPTMAVTPRAAFDRAVAWIDGLSKRGTVPAVAPAPAMLTGPDFVEEAATFGPDRRLFGVICQPTASEATGPILLILNAGRNSHVGWARTGVTIARRLAAQGIASFRMDLGGVGDGAERPGTADTIDAVLYNPALTPEVEAAVDLLDAGGYRSIAVMGACSGAHLALQAAAADARIGGVVLVNIQRFVWRRGETVEQAIASSYAVASSYVSKLWDRRAWTKVLTGERPLLPLALELTKRLAARARGFIPSPETRAARALMDKLHRQDVPVEIVFSEDDAGLEELARHFGSRGRWLTRMPRVRLNYIANTDHDLTPEAARDALFVHTLAAAGTWKTSPAGQVRPAEQRHGFCLALRQPQ
ncbi:serine aminopeptidase domain-containing protein [Phreatobacter stygius]|uniref:Serine aminopeptidase S33 domain-containing protein n=1 Tax=Phreatobacter stygius TaxID=1940610 RepID=A0A4D7AXR5_9HYPH|nr:alpha/beta fold hydrolase [Phreatobacter stygius]QCI63693.1 hypothetical protein E8M01_05230 [Phreatobacter stygius]